jgi:Na+-driven multidrug efflux pump
VRQLVAYNYQRKDFNRIRRAYRWTIVISVIYGVVIYVLLLAIGKSFLQMFDVQPQMMSMAYEYLILNALFIPMISFSVGGLMIFQATNQMLMGCFVAVLQGLIT